MTSWAAQIADHLITRRYRLVCAESCTAGGLAYALTAEAGSSQWFERGYITYTVDSKIECLGVAAELIDRAGAVSEACAIAMAQGALRVSDAAQVALSITGVAGPGGVEGHQPVGEIWCALAARTGTTASQRLFYTGNRQQIRQQAIDGVQSWFLDQLKSM